ncbi:MAG TPA: hypothetical protein VH140_09980 [Candidatus Acidoferrum sp.]|jgi:hypothetical protein|nr:hypothetical protein [Candidatus Acidoferrum sp.]
MDSSIEKIGQFLFPEKIRRYVTFPLVPVFAVALFSVNFALSRLDKSAPLPELTLRNRILSVVHSPAFLFFYYVALALGFWSVYATRTEEKYYQLRVGGYGMLLGGLLGEILSFLPHHP